MPRQRLHTELVNLLDRASQPLYVLDDALVILYLNEAARTWLGAEAEELLGRKCVYASGSELSGLDQAAARLCPPPAVLEGHERLGRRGQTRGPADVFSPGAFRAPSPAR